MNIKRELSDITTKLWAIQDITTNPELKSKLDEVDNLIRDCIRIRTNELESIQSPRTIKSSTMKYGDFLNKLRKEGHSEEAISNVIADNAYPIYEDDDYDIYEQHDFMRRLRYEENEINSSRKPIKSFRDTSNEDTSNDYGFYWEGENIYDKDGNHWYFGDYINGNTGIEPYSSYMQAVKETEDSVRDSFWDDEIADPEDYAYQLIDFAVETLPDPGKFIKEYEGFVKSSRKPIKSSLEDRLVPYLEEFEEGYANALASTDEMGPEVRLDTFYEIFKSDYNLSDDDINKLKDSVEGIWKESKEIE